MNIFTISPSAIKHARHMRWLRIVAWIFAIVTAGLALLVLTFAVTIHTARFHNYLLSTAQKQASQLLGTQVELQNFTVNLSTLRLDIYGLTVHGAEPYADPPILQIQHAEAGIRIVSIFRRKWYLDSFQIDGPVVRVFTDTNGNSNIPKLKKSGGKSNTSIFDLAVRHAALTNGEVYYNNKQSSIAADIQDAQFHASYNVLLQKYSGALSYSNGHLVAGSLQSFPHALSAEFDASPSVFHLRQAKLSTGKSQLLLTATLQNYSDPDLQAQYDAYVEGSDLRSALNNASLPTGLIRARGTAHYHAQANHPVIDAIQLNGTLDGQQLDIQTPSLRARINDIAAQYSLMNGDASVPSLRARLLGGSLTGNARMTALGGHSHSEVNTSLHGISLAQLRGIMHTATMPRNVVIQGGLDAQLNATWGKTLNDLVAHSDVVIHGNISGARETKGNRTSVPVNSVIHGIYNNSSREIALNRSYVHMQQTSLTMNGVMSNRSNVALKLQSNDLHELETIADIFRPAPAGQPVQPLGLAGTASFNGTLAGSTAAPRLTGQLTASQLLVHGTSWRSLQAEIDVSPSLAKLENVQLEPASQGHISLNASAGLIKWSFTKTSPMQVDLDASQLNVADLMKAASAQAPVAGVLSANIKMHGTTLHPFGQGNLSLSRATIYAEPLRTAQLKFSGSGDEVHANLAASLPAGDLRSTMLIRPQDKSYTAQLTANNFRIEKLETVKAKNMDVNGGVNLNASGRGTLDNPQLDASLQIAQLTIQHQAINALNLQVNLQNHVAVANLTSHAVNTSVCANAKVNLTGDYLADASLDTQSIPLQPLLAIYAPDQAANLNGETELHATLHGPLKNKQQLEAHLHIPVLKMGYGNTVQLAAASPIQVDYKDNVISVQRVAIRGTDTDLQLQGSMPATGKAPLSLLVLGTVDLHVAQLFDPDLRSSGQLKFNINSYGAVSGPNVKGQVEIVDANIATGNLPVGLQHGNGVLTLTADRLSISKFQGIVGGGVVTAQGGILYRPNLQFDLGLSARDMRLLYPQGVREGVNANIRLAGTTENAVLGGTVDISDLSFTPAFDLTNFINQFSGGVTTPPSAGFAQNVQLNLAVHSSNNINMISRTLSVNGTANLQVRGTAAQPVILGRINLDSGDLIFNGDRFILNGGTIQFVNPSETQPVVNLALNTTIQQYAIYLRFNGPVEQIHTEYSSDPSLPAADIINLLAFGQTTEANSANPSTPANQAAESLVASQVSSQITSRVSKIAGISQLSINPVLAGGSTQGPPGANITIQQRVSGNLFVTFSSNVASTQNQTIMGQYQISPRVAVSATRDQNGGFAVDTTIKKSW